MKICLKCNISKNENDFRLRHFPKQGKKYRLNTCKSCEIKYNLERYHRIKSTDLYKEIRERRKIATQKSGYHKKRYAVWGRNYQLYKKFGITELDYKRMLKTQKGVCAICGCAETKLVNCSTKQKKVKPLSVDHNHKTGQIRELLCDNCNNGIARFGENVEYMANAISYIEKHKTKLAGALMGV